MRFKLQMLYIYAYITSALLNSDVSFQCSFQCWVGCRWFERQAAKTTRVPRFQVRRPTGRRQPERDQSVTLSQDALTRQTFRVGGGSVDSADCP